MPNQNLKGIDIGGLLPALDRRKSQKPFVVDGKNFVFDIDGPKSAFGGLFLSKQLISNPLHTESFDIEGVSYLFTSTGIMRLDSGTLMWVPVHIFASSIVGNPHKWTRGRVNTLEFFCHPEIGIIYYDTVNLIFNPLSVAGLPDNPVAIAAIRSRLYIAGELEVVWSAQDDGTDLVTDLATGAGFQALSILGGDTISCAIYGMETELSADFGVLVFTTNGILRSRFTGNVGTFSHSVMLRSTAEVLINSFCLIPLESGELVYVTKTGLYATKGSTPKKWSAIFSEYLIQEFKKYDLTRPSIIRLTWIPDEQWFCLSLAETISVPYNRMFVLYVPTERLGYMDKLHYSIVRITIESGPKAGSHWGHIDSDGRFLAWSGLANVEYIADSELSYLFKPLKQYPARYDAVLGAYVLPSVMRMGDVPESNLALHPFGYYTSAYVELPDIVVNLLQFADDAGPPLFDEDYNFLPDSSVDYLVDSGDEDWNDDTTTVLRSVMAMSNPILQLTFTPVSSVFQTLDSKICIGLLRWEEQQFPDELGMVTNMSIGMPISGDLDAAEEDWNLLSGEEDWNLMTDDEDWGYNVTDHIDYNLTFISTLDGYTPFNTVIPDLVKQDAAANFYALMSTGIYHIAEISAVEPGQSFHLKSLEASGILAGRL